MKFRVATTSGGEVIFAGDSQNERPVYYGAPSETGLWQVSIPKFEAFVSAELKDVSFGCSIEEFVFGFEIAELEEWGRWFKNTREYTSYRPKSKQFISVGQIEWKDVKNLSIEKQLIQLGVALLAAIERIGAVKRKPKDFDYIRFAVAMRDILSQCRSTIVAA
jgi:hypothetical protein